MPRGIVNQLSADLSRYIPDDRQVWNNAVNLVDGGNINNCQVEEDFYFRKIYIRASGKDGRGLVILVMNALRDIIDGYKGVKPEIYVPCTCKSCLKEATPTMFLYDKLLKWNAVKDNARVTCNESGETLLIDELLFNVGLQKKMTKTLNIFLASSSELKGDREQFEIFINRENKRFNPDGIFLNLNIWEDFIDTISKTRLQDEYNKSIKESDIFVSLFFTKVGKYTAEEFRTAYKQFRDIGKPQIYTYFKNSTIHMDEIIKEDIDSKFVFQEQLKQFGHFPTIYENIHELQNHFRGQLDKLLASGKI